MWTGCPRASEDRRGGFPGGAACKEERGLGLEAFHQPEMRRCGRGRGTSRHYATGKARYEKSRRPFQKGGGHVRDSQEALVTKRSPVM